MLGGALDWCAKHAPKLLAGGVLLGLAVPPLADLLRPLLPPVIVVNLTLALLRIEFRAVFAYGRRPFLVAAQIMLLLLLSPLLMSLCLEGLSLPAGLAAGLLLMSAAPPITSAPALALILGLDAALAVLVVFATHLLVPFTLPPLALWLLGLDLQIGTAALMLRLAAVVGIAVALAWSLRRWLLSPQFLARQASRIDGLAVVGLVTFACGIMAGVTDRLLDRPSYVLLAVLAAFIGNAGLQLVGILAFWRFGRAIALTAGLMAGNCNMGLVLAALAARADPDVVIFFAMGQLPMYMLPIVALPLYRRLLAARAPT